VVNILHCLMAATLLLPFGVASAATSSAVNLPVTITPSVENDEFVGPFPSWANLKTAYGAVGDGVTDDTAAIQKALNALGPGNPILYFPAGTYKITRSLSLGGQSSVGIIGADPATTTILWAGNSSTPAASFTGSVTLSTPGCSSPSPTCYPVLTVGSGVTGTLAIGQLLSASGIPTPTYIQAFLTGSGGAGTYKIAQLNGQLSTAASESMTTSNQSMLFIGGVNYSRFDRLTFNGQGNAAVAVDQSLPDNVNCCFDTGNEYADDVFENVGIGLLAGNNGFGFAETTVLRSKFINNTVIGAILKNGNALDLWIWSSTFQNNNVGVGNYVPGGQGGAGAFHVYNSIFQNSTTADIAYGYVGVFNFVNNYSIGSRAFIAAGGSGGSDGVLIQRNTILDTTQTRAIEQDDRGPVFLLDNVIRSARGASYSPTPCDELGRRAGTCPVVMIGNFNVPYPNLGYDMFSMGNTFTLGSGTCSTSSPAIVNGRCHSINDQIVSGGSVNPPQPTLPGTPSNLGRTIYEASPTGSGTTCSAASPCSVQQAITQAAVGCSNNVVHIQPGNYQVAATITLPGNCPLEIIGDSNYSRLRSAGANPVMRLLGPSLATLRNFEVDGIGNVQDGIEIDNVDASGMGGRVFVESGVFASSTTNLFVDTIDYANVELHNTQNLYSPAQGIEISGGAYGGQFNQYLGLSALVTGATGYTVSGNANANINGIWNETGVVNSLLDATGTGVVTYSGSFFNVPTSVTSSATITNFTGMAGLVGLYGQTLCPQDGTCGTWGNFSITGKGTGGNVLGLGLTGSSTTYWRDSSGDTNGFLGSQQYDTGEVAEIGSADPTFLTTTLAQLRSHQPTLRVPLLSGVTNVALYRINVSNANYGLHLMKN
jgi:hypothetical protein